MAYTETTETSWGSRLGNSFKGMLTGIAIFIAGTGLLWWNEGDFVATRDALNEAQSMTVELGDYTKMNSQANGQLVHATGVVDTKEILSDPAFGIRETAISLKKEVEYYQWMERSHSEKRKKLGGGEETVTTYTYEAGWTSEPVNSEQFRDPAARTSNRNTVRMTPKGGTLYAKNVSFGAYKMPDFFIKSIGGSEPLEVKIPENVRTQLENSLRTPTWGTYDNYNSMTNPAGMVSVEGNVIYIGPAPSTPTIGDVRLRYTVVRPGATVSLLAVLNGNTFEPYVAENNKKVSKLTMGTKSAKAMFGQAHESNSMMTWVFRGLGVVLCIVGLQMLVAPLSVIADVIPLLGDIVGAGTGIVAGLIGFAWSLIVISIAWLRFRPIVGGCCIAAAVACIAACWVKGRSKRAAAQAPQA